MLPACLSAMSWRSCLSDFPLSRTSSTMRTGLLAKLAGMVLVSMAMSCLIAPSK